MGNAGFGSLDSRRDLTIHDVGESCEGLEVLKVCKQEGSCAKRMVEPVVVPGGPTHTVFVREWFGWSGDISAERERALQLLQRHIHT